MPSSFGKIMKGGEKMEIKEKDDYKIQEFAFRRTNSNYYNVKCKICGHEKCISSQNIRKQNLSHSMLNCKESYYASEYVGKFFGDYKCIGFEIKGSSASILELECKICGKVKKMSLYNIESAKMNHSYMSCGEEYFLNLIGEKIGDLEILGICEGKAKYSPKIKCQCSVCKRILHVSENWLYGFNKHRDCIRFVKNGKYKDAICGRFSNIQERCNNPNNSNYFNYGGRGISLEYENAIDFYDDWIDSFMAHAKIHGIKNTTFDRIDVNGNYAKSNLRLATQKQQCSNTRKTKFFIIKKDDTVILSNNAMEIGRLYGINGNALKNLVSRRSKTSFGWKLIASNISKDDLDEISEREGVTTKVIV